MRAMDAVMAACEALTDEQDLLTREMISRISDKWSLWTLSVLAAADGPLRFSRVLGAVDGVSQKSLTKTLRGLERDGLVTRQIFAEVPPRVEYTITPLGVDMLLQVESLWRWVAGSIGRFEEARAAFDSR